MPLRTGTRATFADERLSMPLPVIAEEENETLSHGNHHHQLHPLKDVDDEAQDTGHHAQKRAAGIG